MTIKQLKSALPSIKKIVGWANFPAEKNELLIQAFIRRSYSQEHPEWQHNQVLELIGDSVLDNFFVRKMCNPKLQVFGSFTKKFQFVSKKDEGELTKIKSNYVNGNELSKHIDNLKLSQYLILGGADEKNNVRNKSSAKEDLFESVIGAVALACDFNNEIIDVVCNQMLEFTSKPQQQEKKDDGIVEMRKLVGAENTITAKNAVGKLLQLCQAKFISAPKYSYNDKVEYDKNNNPIWKCSCKIEGYKYDYYCSGNSKKEARQFISIHILKYILGYEKE